MRLQLALQVERDVKERSIGRRSRCELAGGRQTVGHKLEEARGQVQAVQYSRFTLVV